MYFVIVCNRNKKFSHNIFLGIVWDFPHFIEKSSTQTQTRVQKCISILVFAYSKNKIPKTSGHLVRSIRQQNQSACLLKARLPLNKSWLRSSSESRCMFSVYSKATEIQHKHQKATRYMTHKFYTSILIKNKIPLGIEICRR